MFSVIFVVSSSHKDEAKVLVYLYGNLILEPLNVVLVLNKYNFLKA